MIKTMMALLMTASMAATAQATDYHYDGVVFLPESSDVGPASVYPITFDVGGGGAVADVDIALNRLIFPFFGDIVAGLRAPDGTAVYFLGGAGINGGNHADGGSYVFDDDAAAPIEEYPVVQLVAPGHYRESVYVTSGLTGDPDPFGFGTYSTSLASFNGHAAKGVWQLYLLDQYDGDKGMLDGATLSIATAAVPEPASWATMLVGFGLCGGALRATRVRRATSRATDRAGGPATGRATGWLTGRG